MKNRFDILLFLLPFVVLTANGREISGNLYDVETRQPVARAVVKAIDEAGKTVAFTSSGQDGAFSISSDKKLKSLSIKAMGYEPEDIPLPLGDSGIMLLPKATQLKEVVVAAPDIYQRGDTLVFNVNRYANATDNAILDVIKRLPGVKVDKDGTINYNGKPINKFYIEGNDFIGDQYGLATNNISKDDVKSVEVIENHQPVKALDDIEFSDQAAINLTLKDGAKDKWTGVAKAGTGFAPWLYSGALFTMRLSPKMQNVFTAKADNTGWNPANEIVERDYDRPFSSEYDPNPWMQYISADMIASPLTERRTRDNTSVLADAITAWNAGDASMRLKLDYHRDRLQSLSSFSTRYFTSSIPDFMQQNSLDTDMHCVSAQLNSTINKSGYYLKEKFKAEASWENGNSSISGSSDADQNVERKEISAVNDLRLVKRTDKRLFSLSSRNEFLYTPTSLNVKTQNTSPSQDITTTDFRSTTESQFGCLFGRWRTSLDAGIDLNYHRFRSDLKGIGELLDNHSDLKAFTSGLYVNAKTEYEWRKWQGILSVPFRWNHYDMAGRRDFADIAPAIWIRRQLNAKSAVSISAKFSLKPPASYTFIESTVMCDHRNLFRSTATDRHSELFSFGIGYRYRNPLAALFANASSSYSIQHLPLTMNQIFFGDYVMTTYAKTAGKARTLTANGGISKGLAHGRIVIGMDASFSHSSATSMRDGVQKPFSQDLVSAKPYFKGSLTKWLSINYDLDLRSSSLRISGEKTSTTTSSTQSLNVSFIPSDLLNFSIGVEHYFTRFNPTDQSNLVLFDASATWIPESRWRLSLTATNLLDQRHYRYSTFGTLSQASYDYQIRGRNVMFTCQFRF